MVVESIADRPPLDTILRPFSLGVRTTCPFPLILANSALVVAENTRVGEASNAEAKRSCGITNVVPLGAAVADGVPPSAEGCGLGLQAKRNKAQNRGINTTVNGADILLQSLKFILEPSLSIPDRQTKGGGPTFCANSQTVSDL